MKGKLERNGEGHSRYSPSSVAGDEASVAGVPCVRDGEGQRGIPCGTHLLSQSLRAQCSLPA